MQSGIVVGDDIRQEFQQLRMKRKHRYIIYKLNDAKDGVEVEKLGPRDATFEDMLESVPKNNSR